MIKSRVILNIISFLILLLGLIYIGLSDYYMGFERDLVYREDILENEYLTYINNFFLAVFWFVISFFAIKNIFQNFSLCKLFNLFIFIFLFVITLMYNYNILIETMLFVVLNLFGLFRILIYILEKKIVNDTNISYK
jgi:hypothetical protein